MYLYIYIYEQQIIHNTVLKLWIGIARHNSKVRGIFSKSSCNIYCTYTDEDSLYTIYMFAHELKLQDSSDHIIMTDFSQNTSYVDLTSPSYLSNCYHKSKILLYIICWHFFRLPTPKEYSSLRLIVVLALIIDVVFIYIQLKIIYIQL
jgi:hypothetical protein